MEEEHTKATIIIDFDSLVFLWAHAGVPRYLTNSYQCHDIASNVHQEGIYTHTRIYGADTTVVKCLAPESSTRNSNGKGKKEGHSNKSE